MSLDDAVTLERFLTMRLMMHEPGANVFMAKEAVASVALAHPEWPPLDQRRTVEQWQRWAERYAP